MKTKWDLNQEGFDGLLRWLDSDRDLAGEKYENIRRKLIKISLHRGCTLAAAEELADESINRVIRKVPEIADSYVGDPALYFCRVAHNVFLEHVKKRPDPKALPHSDPPEGVERNYACLERCMEHLVLENRELVLQYYQQEGKAKIDQRKELAGRLGVGVNTLRMRVFRIKESLAECVVECVRQAETF